ncbi:uncharacterized protein LOC114365484 [Ostrinia furnacalis]|uniref:uncharacterized protein LOC114365484 n=1 Tax=Ostrinia furnacalis TaxID=93504 RepID=UPI00103A32AD|nr:uncharacterized protein LOC114365484 [Ostrinia furnacalis]
MHCLKTALCFLALLYGGGGVTKSPGISEFWTDDYKVFEQIYGKTSDKDLYGEQLPRSIYSGVDKTKSQASEKKERYIDHDASEFDSYAFGQRYAQLFAKQEKTTNPPKSFNFISFNDFKPISQQSDPETYTYLKHLEKYNQEQKIKFPKGMGGFKPYLSYNDHDPEEDQAYKSIQDILDAHEANKGSKSVENEDDVNYLTYGPGKGRKKANPRKKPGAEFNKPRCYSGRCRKRATSSVRVRSRPYVRKVVHRLSGY